MSRLVRDNLVVAGGTAVSRVTGLWRSVAIASVLGRGLLSDAYWTANDTPNIVYDLLLGGVLSATLVPLFTTYLWPPKRLTLQSPRTKAQADRGTDVLITTALILMCALTIAAVAVAPWIFRLYTLRPGADIQAADVEVFRAAGAAITRIFLVQILFYGLTGVANAYLNSRKRFAAAAWSPVAANLVTIAALYSVPSAGVREWQAAEVLTNDRLRLTLGWGPTLGIGAMAAIVLIAAWRSGLKYRPVIDFRHPAVRQLMTLSGWTLGFVAANQIAVFVIRNLLINLGSGNLSAYTYAFIFFMLPHGLLAVSISTTFQPQLARDVAERRPQQFSARLTQGIRAIVALTLPAAVLMAVLPESVMRLLEFGQFTLDDARQAAPALAGLALGLSAFSVYQFVLRGFYAHKNSRTPFFLNVFENLFNIVVGLILVGWIGLFGLAFSYALAYVITAVVTLAVMRRQVPSFDPVALVSPIVRMLGAAAVMAIVVFGVATALPSDSRLMSFTSLVVSGIVGLGVYVAVLAIARVDEVGALWRRLRPR